MERAERGGSITNIYVYVYVCIRPSARPAKTQNTNSNSVINPHRLAQRGLQKLSCIICIYSNIRFELGKYIYIYLDNYYSNILIRFKLGKYIWRIVTIIH